MKAGSLLQVQLERRTILRVFCYCTMLPCEQYTEEVSQEAEGLKDSPELSPTLATTAQFLCQSLWPQPSFRNGIHKLNSNLLLVRKECLSTTAIKKSASFSAEISICILLQKCHSLCAMWQIRP